MTRRPTHALVALPAAVLVLLALPTATAFAFNDPAGDVKKGNAAYTGPGAGTVDILSASADQDGNEILFRLEVADLDGLASEADRPDLHVQYALTFRNADNTLFSTRATFNGADRGGGESGCWEFSLHNQATDQWPRADGRIRGNTIEWTIPTRSIGDSTLDGLSDWTVSTWSSSDDRDQFGDNAEATGSNQGAASGGTGQDGSGYAGCSRFLPAPGVLPSLLAVTLLAAFAGLRRLNA